MRVVFMGTPDFALPALEGLIQSPDCQVAAVITQPDRPAGRGQQLKSPPVKEAAERAGIPVHQPARLRNNPQAVELIRSAEPDVMVVAAFGQILPAEIFTIPPFGAVNIHASLLPEYRGASPIARAILDGRTATGITIMLINEGMDTGDILAQETVPIPGDCTAGELEAVLSRRGSSLLLQTLPDYLGGRIVPRPQDHSRASYAPRITRESARIDWRRSRDSIHNQIRAFNPWPVAQCQFHSQVLHIWRSARPEGQTGGSGVPGQVVGIEAEGILIQTGQGLIALRELQLAGRRRMSDRDFANGVRLRTGEILG